MQSVRVRTLILAVAFTVVGGCAGTPDLPEDRLWGSPRQVESTPLGGEALAMMKREMARAHGDMLHFHETLAALDARGDRSGSIQFSRFVDAYMGLHLEPLLASAWQSDHPELAALDVNLRFAVADVLIQLRDPRRVQDVIEEIESRYRGRENMLVEYPIGSQSPLSEGLRLLRERKWRG